MILSRISLLFSLIIFTLFFSSLLTIPALAEDAAPALAKDAAPALAEDDSQLKALEESYQQVLKEIGKVNGTGDTKKMLTLINKMQSLNLSIQELKMKDTKDPYMEMDVSDLKKKMEKIQKEATSSGNTALWTEYGKIAKIYNYKLNRSMSGKMTGGLKRNDGSGSSSLEYFSALEAFRWLAHGDIERGFNGLEAILEGGLSYGNTGTAITLAQMYLDLLNDTNRAIELTNQVQEICLKKLGSDPLDFKDIDVKTWLNYLYGARNTKARILAHMGKEDELDSLIEISRTTWTNHKKSFLQACKDPFTITNVSFLFSGMFTRGAQLGFAADLANKEGKVEKASDYSREALQLYNDLLETLDKIPDKDKKNAMGWRLCILGTKARLVARQSGPEAGLKAYEEYQAVETEFFESQKQVAYGYFYVNSRLEYALLLSTLGRTEEALKVVQLADDRFTSGSESQEMAFYIALSWKPAYVAGTLCDKIGNTKDAISHYQRAIETIENLYQKMRSGKLKGQFLKGDECSETYRRLVKLLIDQKRFNEAFEYLERSKSAVLLDMLKSLPMRERKNWPADLLKKEKEIKKNIKEQKKYLQNEETQEENKGDKSKNSSQDGTRTKTSDNSAELRKSRWDYEILLRDISSYMANLTPKEDGSRFDKVWATKAETLLSKMGNSPHDVLCEYFDDGGNIYCFVMKGSSLQCYPCGDSKAIRKATRKLRRYISSRSRQWKKTASELYSDLIKPWKDSLKDFTNLIIVPTGFLHSLPFSCLVDDEGKLLLDVSPISVISQASLLTRDKLTKPGGEGCLVMADPDGSLPNARIEAEQIKEIQDENGSCLIKMGDKANEGWLKEEMGFLPDSTRRPAVLHLATHGLLEKGMNLFSSLVLAESSYEDGALTVGEIFNELDLRETPIVVLSACNTALGDEDGGDEIVGLSRAFQYAGARWVIASLWEVSDKSSARLMQYFHEELKKTDKASVALRNAQKRIMNIKEWEHPFYWGAFVAYKR
jgi:CHAT domain-containing protein